MWEFLLTQHRFSREIAELPYSQIERLRAMLREAVSQRIEPEKVYEAITLGFERTLAIPSPPLASDLDETRAGKIAMEALLRELSAA
jgi:hypothetical protein